MHPAIIKGWDLPKEEYAEAHQQNRLVKLVTELSNVCNLSCPGCFTKRDEGTWDEKSKKRLPDELSYENQIALIEEAKMLGVKVVDIVGAGEPTLDKNFEPFVGYLTDAGLQTVIFTHGASPRFKKLVELWKNDPVSFFVKLWSQDPLLQQRYVGGSVLDYAIKRDAALETLIQDGYTQGEEVIVDGIPYKTTRVGADILVMQSNLSEIPDLFRFCRIHNIMPEIKTYIPEGPTLFSQNLAQTRYSAEELIVLRKDEVSPAEFLELRHELERIDQEEFGIEKMHTVYPQAVKCTQSMASVYVTITGDIRSCVGTQGSYGKYEAGKGMLAKVIKERRERVGFGCVPRLEDSEKRALLLPEDLRKIYSDGMQ